MKLGNGTCAKSVTPEAAQDGPITVLMFQEALTTLTEIVNVKTTTSKLEPSQLGIVSAM